MEKKRKSSDRLQGPSNPKLWNKLYQMKMQSSRIYPVFGLTKASHVLRRLIATEATEVKPDTPLKSWREIPGPSSLPIIGPILHVLPGGSLHNLVGPQMTQALYKCYGPIVKMDGILNVAPFIFIFDAESSAQILHGENWHPYRPGFKSLEYYRKHHKIKVTPTDPTGLLTDHGDAWKEFRSVVNPVLLQPKTIKLYTSSLEEVARDTIARIKSIRDENNQLTKAFDSEMNLWALESIGVIALGCRLNCINSNLPEDSPVKKMIQIIHDLFMIIEQLDFKPSLWRLFATPAFKKAMKLYEEQERVSKYFIDKGMKGLENKNKIDDEKGVLEKLLEINEDYALIMATDMLFAGVDTVSNTIIATLYLLATNPEKQDKLRAEVLSGQEKKPYTKACIKESMRLYSVISGNFRVTRKEYDVLGYKIPSNTQVLFCHHDMSLMENHFPRPKEFIPERWLSEKDDPLHYKNAHPFAYSPFGFGVRSCIGRRIAELELETFLTHLMANFQVKWSGSPITVHSTSINYIKGPFNFIFKDI